MTSQSCQRFMDSEHSGDHVKIKDAVFNQARALMRRSTMLYSFFISFLHGKQTQSTDRVERPGKSPKMLGVSGLV